jgi:hypothetical protein
LRKDKIMNQVKILFLTIVFLPIFWNCTGGNGAEQAISYTFENDIGAWHSGKSVQFSRSDEKRHEGQMSLKIHGVSPAKSWSFIETKHISLEKGKHYRLDGWMLVDFAGIDMPFLKCALFIYGGSWIKNSLSTQYNKEQIKEWQDLIAEFDTPVDKETELVLAVEKRPFDEAVGATIYIDDIHLSIID